MKESLFFYGWVVREDLTDCHRVICEALSLAVETYLNTGEVQIRGQMILAMDTFEPLDKAVLFFT